LKTLLETGESMGSTVSNVTPGPRHLLEGRTRVFVTYIKSIADQVWKALTEGEETKQYFFGRRVESEWRVGSTFNYWDDEGHGLDVTGEVLECEPPYRLVLTWSVPWVEELRGMPPTRVTYLIEPLDGFVRLSVTEEVSEEIPEKFLEGGKQGWPTILGSLKSYLETGAALPM
jgi:uncharacterized protein YndB with AHSA1/START domain